MDRGKRARFLVAVVAVVGIALGVFSLPAGAATTPDLTGTWINVDAPTLPAGHHYVGLWWE